MKKKRPGAQAENVSIYPLKLQEGVDFLVGNNPKKKAEELLEEGGKGRAKKEL